MFPLKQTMLTGLPSQKPPSTKSDDMLSWFLLDPVEEASHNTPQNQMQHHIHPNLASHANLPSQPPLPHSTPGVHFPAIADDLKIPAVERPSRKRSISAIATPSLSSAEDFQPNTTLFTAPVTPKTGLRSQRIKSTRAGSTINISDSKSTAKKGEEPQDKVKKIRLEKNRKSARQCRLRKKEHIADLEHRVRELEQENLTLRAKLEQEQGEKQHVGLQKDLIAEKLKTLLSTNASEDQLSSTLIQFAELYGDYGRDRRNSLQYHLNQLKRVMSATEVTKMALWSLQQDAEFYSERAPDLASDPEIVNLTGSESLWQLLTKEMGLSATQKQRLLNLRPFFRDLGKHLEACDAKVAAVEAAIDEKNDQIKLAIKKLAGIISPQQAAQYIRWVIQNRACIQMLNKLWDSKPN